MKMKIKIVKRTGNRASDNEKAARAFAALVADGYSTGNITTEVVEDFTYDAYSAGGSQESLDNVTVLIAKR